MCSFSINVRSQFKLNNSNNESETTAPLTWDSPSSEAQCTTSLNIITNGDRQDTSLEPGTAESLELEYDFKQRCIFFSHKMAIVSDNFIVIGS